MPVYVDTLREYPKTHGHSKWCHLLSDNFDELETFARVMGLHPDWYQHKSYPHYDLTEKKRIQALKLGAIEISNKELIDLIRKENKGENY